MDKGHKVTVVSKMESQLEEKEESGSLSYLDVEHNSFMRLTSLLILLKILIPSYCPQVFLYECRGSSCGMELTSSSL